MEMLPLKLMLQEMLKLLEIERLQEI